MEALEASKPQKVFSQIKAFVEPKIESLSNVTSNIVETMIEPKLDSLTNMTNSILEQQQSQAEETFNKFIKVLCNSCWIMNEPFVNSQLLLELNFNLELFMNLL